MRIFVKLLKYFPMITRKAGILDIKMLFLSEEKHIIPSFSPNIRPSIILFSSIFWIPVSFGECHLPILHFRPFLQPISGFCRIYNDINILLHGEFKAFLILAEPTNYTNNENQAVSVTVDYMDMMQSTQKNLVTIQWFR